MEPIKEISNAELNMTQMNSISQENQWKTKFLLVGTAVGAVVGLGTAYLLTRTAEEANSGPPKSPPVTRSKSASVLLVSCGESLLWVIAASNRLPFTPFLAENR